MQSEGRGPGFGPSLSLADLPTHLVVVCAGARCHELPWLPALQKLQLGFFVFLYLLVHNLPQLHMHAVIQSLIVSVYCVA